MSLLFKKNKSKVIPVVLLVLLVALMLSRVLRPSAESNPQVSISYNEASDHTGIVAEVCGEVVSTTFATNVGGEPTFINFGADYPNQTFTVVIWGENLGRWRALPADLYSGQYICVRGRINMHNGTPQIVVSRPDAISFNPRYN